MPTLSSVVIEARLMIKKHILKADILSTQREYARVYYSSGLSEQLDTVRTLQSDLQIVLRKCLGTTTFEDKNDDARNARVAALERKYEQSVCDAFQRC